VHKRKPEDNILNQLKPNEKIFRVVSVERFFELITGKTLALVKPYKWNDPFENFLSKTIFINSKKERTGFNLTNDFFGQCWTLREECDGIWKNYASLTNGVKIQTTATKLLKTIYNTNDKWAPQCYFIGKVDYKSTNDIIDFLRDEYFPQWLTDTSGKNVAKMLLLKRNEFRYEQEVRLLYSDIEKNYKEKDFVSFQVDPTKLIESITFAPMTNEYLFEIYKKQLIDLGFSSESIKKSNLYDPLKIEIKSDGL
jgi:hypothetical protein